MDALFFQAQHYLPVWWQILLAPDRKPEQRHDVQFCSEMQ